MEQKPLGVKQQTPNQDAGEDSLQLEVKQKLLHTPGEKTRKHCDSTYTGFEKSSANSALVTLSGYLLAIAPCLNSPPLRVFHFPNKRLALDSSSPVSKCLVSSFTTSPFSRSFPPTLAGQQSIFPSLLQSFPVLSPQAVPLPEGSQRGVSRELRISPNQAMEHLTI